MTRLRLLHLFDEYLNPTENWAFRLLESIPDADIVIGARHFVDNRFSPSRFERIEFPFRRLDRGQRSFAGLARDAAVSGLLRFYPLYLSTLVGRVDVVHSHFSYVGWHFRRVARKLRVPHVVSFYGFDYERLPHEQPIWRSRYPLLFEQADLFLCEGPHGARALQRIGCPAHKTRVARLGVDVARIPVARRAKKPGELALLQVATFNEKKGHLYTIKAFLDASRDCPNMTLTLIGGDPDGRQRSLRDLLRGSSADRKVTFTDRVDPDDLHARMGAYQIFIHPSCYSKDMDCEGGAPVVLLDAQASGMPIISTTHCDIPDEVVQGVSGLLTPEKDSASLAASIRRFYAMGDSEYRRFSDAARNHVEQHYDARKNAAELASVYRRLSER